MSDGANCQRLVLKFCKFYPLLCYLSRGKSDPEPATNTDPAVGIRASSPHHRLDVSLLATPLVFEYEEHHRLVHCQNARSPLAEDLCADLHVISGIARHGAKTKASQGKLLILVINAPVFFALTHPQNVWNK